jgi:hypothetical protein
MTPSCFYLFRFTSGNITVAAIVADYLLSLIGEVRTHGRQPFQGVKDLLLLAAL